MEGTLTSFVYSWSLVLDPQALRGQQTWNLLPDLDPRVAGGTRTSDLLVPV